MSRYVGEPVVVGDPRQGAGPDTRAGEVDPCRVKRLPGAARAQWAMTDLVTRM
jgi:hypothetical protein